MQYIWLFGYFYYTGFPAVVSKTALQLFLFMLHLPRKTQKNPPHVPRAADFKCRPADGRAENLLTGAHRHEKGPAALAAQQDVNAVDLAHERGGDDLRRAESREAPAL